MNLAAGRGAAVAFAAAAVLTAVPAIAADAVSDSNVFGALHARAIGPSVMSGQIMATDATAARPGAS